MPQDMSPITAGADVNVVHHPAFGPALPGLNWVPAPRYLLRRDRVLDHLSGVAPCRVLDIGCGPATLLSELAARGFEAHGVDRSAQALGLARRVGRGLPMTLSAELDPATKGSFDLMFSFEVIEHLEEDVAEMRAWRDYLAPGGRMILSTPAHPDRWNAADVWAGHVRRYERDDLRRRVEAAGFTVEVVECYGYPLANMMEHLRAAAYARALSRKAGRGDAGALTDESGSDRSVEARFWRPYASFPSTQAMRAFCRMQRRFLQTDLGNGYLVVARKAAP